MSRRLVIRSALVSAGAVGFAGLSSLAQNIASSEARWPGILDYVRRYPWVATGLGGVASAVLYFVERSWPTPDSTSGARPRSVDMGRTTNYGQLNIFQGDPPAVVGNVATPVGASAPPTRPSDRLSKRAVLYWTSPWLDSGTWEQRVVDAVKAAKPGLLCVELNEKNLVSPDIGAIVLVISSAKFPQVKRRALTQLRLAKSHRPLVRVIMAAVGPSDQPLQYDDGVQLLRTAGYTSDTTRFLICDTEEDLEMKLLSQIQVAIKVGTDQADLELMINSASDQEIQT